MIRFSLFFPVFTIWSLALAGCSAPERTDTDRRTSSNKKTFSAEDRRIAKALSLGGYELRSASTPYDEAILCAAALKALDNRLEGSGVLTNEQQRAFAQVQALYTQRAVSSGKGSAQIAQDQRGVEDAYPDKNVLGRIAIGCLRELT